MCTTPLTCFMLSQGPIEPSHRLMSLECFEGRPFGNQMTPPRAAKAARPRAALLHHEAPTHALHGH